MTKVVIFNIIKNVERQKKIKFIDKRILRDGRPNAHKPSRGSARHLDYIILIMFNKLKGLLAERNMAARELAKVLDISENSVYAKLNGKLQFKPSEIVAICDFLEIPKQEIHSYFF